MSLEELLKEPENSSVWKGQRKKLIRVLVGVSIAAVALTGGAAYFLIHENHARKREAQAFEQEKKAKSLAELMRVQEEAKKLHEEVAGRLRRPDRVLIRQASAFRGSGARAGGRVTQLVDFDPGEGFASVAPEANKPYIPTGAVFLAQLITPIKTSVEKTFVMGETTREFRMDMDRRIPKGCRLIGRSHLDTVLKGVVVEFDTLVLPSGIETSVSGLGLSRNALAEIDGLYFSDKLQTYGVALAFGFLSGFAAGARETEPTLLGPTPDVNITNQVLSGVSTASFQVADDLLRDVQQRSVEYVVIPAGEQIFVALTRRYEMSQGKGVSK
jgi:hypothetical protein